MKKVVTGQIIVTLITLAVYFIILHFTGDKGITSIIIAAAATVAVVSYDDVATVADVVVFIIIATVVAVIVGDVAATVVSVAATVVSVVSCDDVELRKKKAVLIYGIQFVVILAVMLLF